MVKQRHRSDQGFTLLELTIAVAVFMIVLGATAQALVSYYVTLDVQNQRFVASRNCTAVLSAMRNTRDANPDNFPGAVTAAWPDGAEVPALASLPREQITVTYTNPSANPLDVLVRSTWVDLRGRTLTMSVSTILTDR